MLTEKGQYFTHELRRIAEVRLPFAIINVEERGDILDIMCYHEGDCLRQSYTSHGFEGFKKGEIFTAASNCIRNFINREYVTFLSKKLSDSIKVKKSNKTLLLCTMIIRI